MNSLKILFTLIIAFVIQIGIAQTNSPLLTSIQTIEGGDGVYASWVDADSSAAGFRLYYATNDAMDTWALAADETTLTLDQTEVSIASQSDFVDVPTESVNHFRLVSVSATGDESNFGDTYSKSSNSENEKVLIVDGFNRTSGSYNAATHNFVAGYLIGLRNSKDLDISSVSNIKIAEDSTILNQFDLVVWFVGDEAVPDESFSTKEQNYLKPYLQNGGKLIASGSEIGWDLDNNGSAEDKLFINEYLKVVYAGDGDASFTPAAGIDSTVFAGVRVQFGAIYVEDYPDEFTPSVGATALLNYNAPGGIAMVGYKGMFPEGTAEGGVVTMGITLETAPLADQQALLRQILVYFELLEGVGPPSAPQLTSIQTIEGNDGVHASWIANSEPSFGGYRLYYATDDSMNVWAIAANEATLTPDVTEISIASESAYIDVPSAPANHFRLVAVSVTGEESGHGDIYSKSSNSGFDKILIVDGFDRISGSYKETTHDFVTGYVMGLRNSKPLDISSLANEKIAEDSTILNQFDLVIWFLGDESTVDESLTTQEQNYLKPYLQNGGKLVISGSELGWDLDNKGEEADKSFINEYLKAVYAEDGNVTYTPATGIDSTDFEGVVVQFGSVYVEDYPDAFNPSEGATALMNYNSPGGTAAIGYKGLFPDGTVEGGVITTGITLESAPLADQEDFLRQVLVYFELGQSVSPPSDPQLTSIQTVEDNDGVYASWIANPEESFGGYRLYYATDDDMNEWALAADETTMTLDKTEISIASESDYIDVPAGPVNHFRLVAVSVTGNESGHGDTYSKSSNSGEPKVLIVDAFDRTSGSYSETTHDFVTGYLIGLRNSQDLDISSLDNDKIAEDSTILNQFDLVIWFMGDESTSGETFTTKEQNYVKPYLQNGGNLVVSGSELGWDLENNGSADDILFLNEYLKAFYAGDGDVSYTPATGIDSTVFAGVVVPFGVTYVEDYPDEFNPAEGGTALLKYNAPGGNAAVGYKGMFPEGTVEGGVITTGITIETALLEDQENLLRQILVYFEIGEDIVSTQDLELTRSVDLAIHPNPSSHAAVLTLTTPNIIQNNVQLTAVNVDGKVVLNNMVNLNSKSTTIDIPSEEWPAGTYFISVATDRNIETILFIKL